MHEGRLRQRAVMLPAHMPGRANMQVIRAIIEAPSEALGLGPARRLGLTTCAGATQRCSVLPQLPVGDRAEKPALFIPVANVSAVEPQALP
jgi:hypothetical protein